MVSSSFWERMSREQRRAERKVLTVCKSRIKDWNIMSSPLVWPSYDVYFIDGFKLTLICYKSIAYIFLIIIVLAIFVSIEPLFIPSKSQNSSRYNCDRCNLEFRCHCTHPSTNKSCLVSYSSFSVFDSLSACTSIEVLLVSLEIVLDVSTTHVFAKLGTLCIRPWGA
jgi:hypothetical protein